MIIQSCQFCQYYNFANDIDVLKKSVRNQGTCDLTLILKLSLENILLNKDKHWFSLEVFIDSFANKPSQYRWRTNMLLSAWWLTQCFTIYYREPFSSTPQDELATICYSAPFILFFLPICLRVDKACAQTQRMRTVAHCRINVKPYWQSCVESENI